MKIRTVGETRAVVPSCFVADDVKWGSSPVTGLECPRGFQEVKVARFHDDDTGWW